MSAPYAVPKHEVLVEVALAGGPPMKLKLFLNECAQTHPGFERPSDLLNGSMCFLPAMDEHGDLVMLNRDSLTVVSVSAEHEFGIDTPRPEELAADDATRALVAVTLIDGSTIRGLLTYLLPESHRRLQDFLNQEDRFLTLHEGSSAKLVNKLRIARVEPI
ncbi:MAG TPA: hypothetical protein VFE84_14410 [Patescibacteria group bacterium]|nr:hypothetical protein [Patescibacteria group bacterium]